MAALSWAASLRAEEPLRPVSSAFMLEGGSSHLLDTYLSPLKYTGWHTAFSYQRAQAMKFAPATWRQQLDLGVEINNAGNPARNASLLYGNLSAAWSMSRLWRLPHRLTVTAGGRVEGNLGGIYSNRNGNNPASLKTDLSLGNLLWFVEPALKFDFADLTTATLPGNGNARYEGSSSLYELDIEGSLAIINDCLNPYTTPVTEDMVRMIQGE